MTWQSLARLLGLLAAVALTGFVLRGAYQWLGSGPPSARSVRSTVHGYLKQQAGKRDFRADYDLKLKPTIGSQEAQAARLKEQVATLQTNLANLRGQISALRKESQAQQFQERGAKQKLQFAESDVAEKQRRLTRRQQEFTAAKDSLAAASTNVLTFQQHLAGLRQSEQQLTNDSLATLARLEALQTNAAALQSGLDEVQAGSKADARQLHLKERALKTLQTDLETRLARLAQDTNDLTLQAAVDTARTNLALGEAEALQLRASLTNAARKLAALQDQATDVRQQIVAAQKDSAALRQAFTNQRQKLRVDLPELPRREGRLRIAQSALTTAQEQLTAAQQEVAAARKTLAEQQAALAAAQKTQAATAADLAARQAEHDRRQSEFDTFQKQLAALQKAIYANQQLLTRQPQVFLTESRKQLANATSYRQIYLLIGQHLWLAEELLDTQAPDHQRTALRLIIEASQYAGQDAQDPWLAARICEGYLWPNLNLKDAQGKPVHPPEDLLQTCSQAFQRAEENDYVIRNGRLLLHYAASERRADAARYFLASALEQAGDLREAIQFYGQIQDTNLVKRAGQRRAFAEQKLARRSGN